MNPVDLPNGKWFSEDTYSLLQGKPSGGFYRPT